ncbi:MAG TPA: cytochrome c biogenesis protein CcdA [Xanthobacteraceae bacterium]|nr:cytochrome c biogenesis protein CcdA [Xanthobacteraceae bacterium]
MIAEAERLIQSSLAGGSPLALPLALFGGLLVSLNPCCFLLYPAAAATCCVAAQCEPRRSVALGNAVAFVFGTVVATTALGVAAAALGGTLMSVGGNWLRYAVALVPIIMGLYALGWIQLPVGSSSDEPKAGGLGLAFLTGLLLSVVLAPCGTPVLAAILSYAAYQGKVSYGGLLMFLYGLGVGVPMLLIGTGAGQLTRRLAGFGWRPLIDQAAGVVLLAVGFYLLWSA